MKEIKMEEPSKVIIKRIIVHVLDTNMQVPVISDEEHPIDSDVEDYISRHIIKVLKDDDIKTAEFMPESKIKTICEDILKDAEGFSLLTGKTAGLLYEIMLKNVDIPSADLICSLFELDNILFFGILKFNYRFSYIHYIDNLSEGKQNKLIRQKTTLPGENQRLDECAFINLENFTIKLIEKRFEVNGEKINYFSDLFLGCRGDISNKEKIKIFNKANDSFNKKYYSEDYKKELDIRTAVSESFEENQAIDINAVAQRVYRNNPQMQKAYIDSIEEAGLMDKQIVPSEKLIEKNFKKQILKTDNGIEINIPVDFYKDLRKIEFINNPDGTISILIKNVNKIFNK
jgi:hypothetical protein